MRLLITGGHGSLGRATFLEAIKRFPSAIIECPTRDELNLLKLEQTKDFIEKFKPTHVVHLAARVFGIQGHLNFPMDSLIQNTQIDLNIFSALSENPPKWIFYSSTVAAYGFPYDNIPLQESDLFKGEPHSSEYGYAQSKRFAYAYLKLLEKEKNTQFTYGLLTNLYSAEDRFLGGNGHVLISLVNKALEAKLGNEVLSIWGSGRATRDFLSTHSASGIICDLFDQNLGIINIGTGVEIGIDQIAKVIEKEFLLEKGYVFTGQKEGILNRYSDIQKLQKYSKIANELDPLEEIKRFIREYAGNHLTSAI